MICLFEKNAASFDGSGICKLDPSVCTVSEVAGGSYTLHMEHPIDENGKYAMLTEERIIRAPVPTLVIPAITLPEAKIWQTTAEAKLYSVLPATKRIPCDESIKRVKQNPSAYAWRASVAYQSGNLCTYANNIYRALQFNFSVVPTSASQVWQYVTTVAGSGDTIITTGGTVIETLASGVMISKIADYNATYMQVRALSGNTGYIERALCEETSVSEEGETIAPQTIKEQLFRIVQVGGEDDTQTITVEAEHISYDFRGNALYSCKVVDAEPMTAISIIRGSLLDADDRVIVSNISGKRISQDWSFLNPINALLDPDGGLVPETGAKLIRNNRDFYILDNSHPHKGIDMTYGHNLIGVRWNRNTQNVITRVLPRCGDGNGGYLYIDDIYVESDISTQYAYQRTEMLDCGYDVGDEYEKADGTTITLDEAAAKAQMEEDAQKRFTVDRADAIEVDLEVQFLLIGDTVEYAQYKGLQTVNLYDEITVRMDGTGMTATAQVCEYEYDSILGRYNSIRIGDVKSMQRRIPGYRLKKGSISYDKLGNSIISRIKGSAAQPTGGATETEVSGNGG